MKKLTIILFLLITGSIHGQRSRHVKEEWNTKAVNLNQSMFAGESWHHLDWFGLYYQTYDWWIYHCDKGWLYPESDGACGVWLWYSRIGSWVWTDCNVYPYAWNNSTHEWFNFCVRDEKGTIAAY